MHLNDNIPPDPEAEITENETSSRGKHQPIWNVNKSQVCVCVWGGGGGGEGGGERGRGGRGGGQCDIYMGEVFYSYNYFMSIVIKPLRHGFCFGC